MDNLQTEQQPIFNISEARDNESRESIHISQSARGSLRFDFRITGLNVEATKNKIIEIKEMLEEFEVKKKR